MKGRVKGSIMFPASRGMKPVPWAPTHKLYKTIKVLKEGGLTDWPPEATEPQGRSEMPKERGAAAIAAEELIAAESAVSSAREALREASDQLARASLGVALLPPAERAEAYRLLLSRASPEGT